MFYSQGFQERAFGRAAGRGDDFRPEMVRNLNRGHPHPTRTGVNENTLSLAHPRDILQCVPGSHENHGERGRLLE